MSSCKPYFEPTNTNVKLNGSPYNPYHDPTQYCKLVSILQHLTFIISYIYYVIQHVRFFMSDQLTRHM